MIDSGDYDAEKDFSASIEECYRAIRERRAHGGVPWMPPDFVDVLPLQPPFTEPTFSMSFGKELGGKKLALSAEDLARVTALLGTDPTDRHVELSPCADNLHIRVKVVRS